MADNLETILGRLPAAIERLQRTNEQADAEALRVTQEEGDKLRAAVTDANQSSQEDFDKAIDALRNFERNQELETQLLAERAESTAGQALALKKQLEEQGKVAEHNKEYSKLAYRAQKEDLAEKLKNAETPAARKEIKEDQRKLAKKEGSRLDKLIAGIDGIWDMGKKTAKKAGMGAIALLSTLAIGGLLIALGKFLQSDAFKDMTKYIKGTIIPAIEDFWEFLKEWWKPIVIALSAVVVTLEALGMIALFASISAGYVALKAATTKHVIDPLKASAFGTKVAELWRKLWLAIKVGYAALKAKTILHILDPLKAVAAGITVKIWSFMGKILPALVALKVFFLSTLLPALVAWAIPIGIVVGVVALVALALFALRNAFIDFCETLNKTGSIAEALKVGVAKFMGTILGFIPWLVLKLVGWVAGLFGFKEFEEKVNAIDPIQWISDIIKGMFDCIHEWFGLLFRDPVGAIVVLVGGYLSLFKDFGGWVYRKALKPVIDWIGELFGVTDASECLENYIGAKIKLLKDFGGWMYGKTIKPVIDWVSDLFADPMAALKALWKGILGEHESLTDMLFSPVNKAIAWVQCLFGWGDPAEPFTVQKFIGEVWAKVKSWFTGLFKWAAKKEAGDSWVVCIIKDSLTGVKKWFVDLFDMDIGKAMAKILDVALWLPNLIKDGIFKVTKWMLELFGFDAAAEKVANANDWSFGSLIANAVCAVFEWLGDLFDIDLMAMAKKLPGYDTFMSVFGGDKDVSTMSAEDKTEEIEDIKSKMARTQNVIDNFNERLADTGFAKLGKSQRKTTEGLLANTQAVQAERQTRLTALQRKQMGGPVKKGVPYLVGEGTVQPELFVPSSSGMILSAQRTSQMLQAGLQRGATGGGGIGGGVVTNIDARSSSSVTATGNTGQGPIRNNKYAGLNTVAA